MGIVSWQKWIDRWIDIWMELKKKKKKYKEEIDRQKGRRIFRNPHVVSDSSNSWSIIYVGFFLPTFFPSQLIRP